MQQQSTTDATPWRSVERARGFHVSRETQGRTEFLLNEVRRVRIFRKPETAQQAADRANKAAK